MQHQFTPRGCRRATALLAAVTGFGCALTLQAGETERFAVTLLRYAEAGNAAPVAAQVARFQAARQTDGGKGQLEALAAKLDGGTWQGVIKGAAAQAQLLGVTFAYPAPANPFAAADVVAAVEVQALNPKHSITDQLCLYRELQPIFPDLPLYQPRLAKQLQAMLNSVTLENHAVLLKQLDQLLVRLPGDTFIASCRTWIQDLVKQDTAREAAVSEALRKLRDVTREFREYETAHAAKDINEERRLQQLPVAEREKLKQERAQLEGKLATARAQAKQAESAPDFADLKKEMLARAHKALALPPPASKAETP